MRWTFKLYDASGDGALEQQEVAGDDVLGDLDDGLGDLKDGLGDLEDGRGDLEDGLGDFEDGLKYNNYFPGSADNAIHTGGIL